MKAIDLFSGAGGMSLGADQAGINIICAVEKDEHACSTFRRNFPQIELFEDDIRLFAPPELPAHGSLVFGGPPCQGFSTSNQRTRNTSNPENWMYREFFRIVKESCPERVVFENVKGLIDTAHGMFANLIINEMNVLGYTVSICLLNSYDFGVPQLRNRLFVIGNKYGKQVSIKKNRISKINVAEAILDLPEVENGNSISSLPYRIIGEKDQISSYAKKLRNKSGVCINNLVTKSSDAILERYRHVPQGGNWQDIPKELMANYADSSRCHTGIYHRLRLDHPSVVVGNFRKNMLIHPTKNRGLSVREAARLQSFPDSFEFCGSIGFQQQQVGNAVPPLLAKVVFSSLT